MLLDPFSNLGKVLVLLSDVVALAQVDEVDDGLGGEEEEGLMVSTCAELSQYITSNIVAIRTRA